MESQKEIWQAIDKLSERNSTLEARMSAHDAKHEVFLEEFRESRRERKEQIESIAHAINSRLGDFDHKVDILTDKVSEAHGMAKFGKMVAGFLLTICGLLLAWHQTFK